MDKKRLKISKQKIAIFSVFVFVATIFWFLDALNREYTTKINYPVTFYNLPKDVLINSKYPKELSVTIKAHGFDIIGKMNVSKPVKVNVSKYAIKDKIDNLKLSLSLNKISNDLFPELNNIEIINIEPEVVVFKVVKISEKKVPVKLKIDFTTSDLFMQSGKVLVSPDIITVSGQKKDLQKLSFVETKLEKFKELKDTLKVNVKLKEIPNVKFSQDFVSIVLPIEKFTENEINVSIKVINCPDSINLVTFPNEVKLAYKVALSKFNFVSENDFIVVADYKQVEDNKEKIHIEIKEYPEYIKSLKVYPEYLGYIVKKQE